MSDGSEDSNIKHPNIRILSDAGAGAGAPVLVPVVAV